MLLCQYCIKSALKLQLPFVGAGVLDCPLLADYGWLELLCCKSNIKLSFLVGLHLHLTSEDENLPATRLVERLRGSTFYVAKAT